MCLVDLLFPMTLYKPYKEASVLTLCVVARVHELLNVVKESSTFFIMCTDIVM